MTNFVAGIAAVAVAGITALVILIPNYTRELESFDRVSNAAHSARYDAEDPASILSAVQKHEAAVRAYDKLSPKAKDERSSIGAVHRGTIRHLKDLLAAALAARQFASSAEALANDVPPVDDFTLDGAWLEKALLLRTQGRSPRLEAAIDGVRERRERHFYSSIQSEYEKLIRARSFGKAKRLVDGFIAHSDLPEERAKAQRRSASLVAEAREGLSAVIRECRGLRKLGMSPEQIRKEYDERVRDNYSLVLPAEEIKNVSFE